jgi:outer membrane protein assembly factor BamB
MKKNRRYYSGVRIGRTTICCSAGALAALAASSIGGAAQVFQLSLFPVEAVWSRSLNGILSAGPAFNGARGYFPIDGDRLTAYDVVEGREMWTAAVRARSRPVAGDGLVFVESADALMGLSEADGSAAWRLPFPEPLAVPLVWDNGWLVAAGASGTVIALRAVDGYVVWRRDVGARVHAPPALAADRVYLSTEDARVVALAVETGQQVWERRLGGPGHEILAFDDRLYVGSTDNFFYCVLTADGRVAWRWRTGADVIGLPVADDRRVYFVSMDNVLRALDRQSGSQQWKRALPLRPTAGPVHAGGTLLVSGLAPTLQAYSARDGAPLGEIKAGGALAAPPHPIASTLPMVAFAVRDIAGDRLQAVARRVEPAVVPVAPLPNAVQVR